MNKKPLWKLIPVLVLPILLLLLLTVAAWFWNPIAFFVALPLVLAVCIYSLWNVLHMRKHIRDVLRDVGRQLNQAERESLATFPLPVTVISASGEILWYNDLFCDKVLRGEDMFGGSVSTVCGDRTAEELKRKPAWDVTFKERRYTVFTSPVSGRDPGMLALYYVDNTELKATADADRRSRPVLLLVYIDNLEELTQNSRSSERAQISGRVETLLEDWISAGNGILQKYDDDRFLAVLEQQYYEEVVRQKFDILDRVRALTVGDQHAHVTLSIGVGRGESFRQAELTARQSLEMALGRGGDQAAERTENGYDFYGGLSKGVEKRNKVRTRIVASALTELIRESDNVLVMGHRYSDLDCLGSACALVTLMRGMGKDAHVVIHRQSSLAGELLQRYETAGRGGWFLEPDAALGQVRERTQLVITDTHNPAMLESLDLYHRVKNVAVIDHHRKMVEYVDNATLFYHEPYASSASEMVAELVQYIGYESLSRLDAEALLSGIMLDTRSFVMKAGVRTFEAAAFLKKLGADLVEVKRLFSGSMELYRRKSDIISTVYMYNNKAIAFHESGGTEIRIAAAQAADELLSIQGVDASFALFPDNGGVNISARSLGDFNVQLTMEALGGGGHLNMAGAFLANTDLSTAQERLKTAIDEQMKTMQSDLSVHGIGQE
ncbi:MAG: DHH family phosphoesterase [Clostridia bacterium]|nr:DHH family phosphoesterase [Clostridia bacterium]